MALNTTDAYGKRDFDIPPNVRIYHFAGTQYGGGDPLNQPPTVLPSFPANCQLRSNSNPFIPAQRALLVALQQWITHGKEPPRSLYPTLSRGSLMPVTQIKVPYIPAVNFTLPGLYAQRFHLDRGPDFDERDVSGVMQEPPLVGPAYAGLAEIHKLYRCHDRIPLRERSSHALSARGSLADYQGRAGCGYRDPRKLVKPYSCHLE
jgi:hypothetical protein